MQYIMSVYFITLYDVFLTLIKFFLLFKPNQTATLRESSSKWKLKTKTFFNVEQKTNLDLLLGWHACLSSIKPQRFLNLDRFRC